LDFVGKKRKFSTIRGCYTSPPVGPALTTNTNNILLLGKNIQKIHKFQQKANPDENERLSDALLLIPSNGLFIKLVICYLLS
jgi:hypothetical protein